MSKKAIFAQTEQIPWVDVAAELRDQYGWEICYFIGGKKQSKKAAASFPDTVFHTKDLARSVSSDPLFSFGRNLVVGPVLS